MQGWVKVGTRSLSRPAGSIEGCGVEPFTPFDTRSARATLWVQHAHFCHFDIALATMRSIAGRCSTSTLTTAVNRRPNGAAGR
jgi:hypothetical protein